MRNLFLSAAFPSQGKITANPSFDKRHMRAIELALREAWKRTHLKTKHSKALLTAAEEMITHLFREELHELWANGLVAGYDPTTFERPHIGAEFPALNTMMKLKRPDIVFGLCGTPRPGTGIGLYDQIFVECKLLTKPKPNVGNYCSDGLQRFVTGAYAWGVREAMMVGYVRDGETLPDALDKEMAKPHSQEMLNHPIPLKKCPLTTINPPIYMSVHQRHWSYVATRGVPGPIEIRHLWLQI